MIRPLLTVSTGTLVSRLLGFLRDAMVAALLGAGPVAVMMGLLNARRRFVLTAFSPILFNLALIGMMLMLLLWPQDATHAAPVMAADVGFAGLLQLLILARPAGGERLAAPLKVS